MVWGGFGAIGMAKSPLSSPSGRRVGDEGAFRAAFSQGERGRDVSLGLRRPVHIIGECEREKLRIVARRVGNRPRALAQDVLVFTGSTDPFDRAGFRALVGHENLVAVAVGLT